jgi:hypothetical protein
MRQGIGGAQLLPAGHSESERGGSRLAGKFAGRQDARCRNGRPGGRLTGRDCRVGLAREFELARKFRLDPGGAAPRF